MYYEPDYTISGDTMQILLMQINVDFIITDYYLLCKFYAALRKDIHQALVTYFIFTCYTFHSVSVISL